MIWDPLTRSNIHDIELVQNSTKWHYEDVPQVGGDEWATASVSGREKNPGSLKQRSVLHSIQTLWLDCLREKASDSNHSSSCQRRACLLQCLYQPRQQIIIRKQQNAAPISNPEAEHVKTRVAVEVLPQYNNNYNN